MAPYRVAVLGGSEDQPTSNREQTEEGGEALALRWLNGLGAVGRGRGHHGKRRDIRAFKSLRRRVIFDI
jgi:hypothetical protein